MTDNGTQPLGSRSIVLVLLTAALWGGTPVAISYSIDTLPPIAVAALRFALAAVFMFFWCRFEGSGLRLKPGQLKPALITGSLLFVQISLFNLGIWWSSSSHATMLINTFVFWVVAIEQSVTKTDRLTPARALGLLVAATGTLILLTRDESTVRGLDVPSLAGDAILISSAFLLGIKIVYTKHALRFVEPGKLIFWHDVVGVILFSTYSLLMEETTVASYTREAVLGLLYQGVLVAGLCFAVQAHLLKRHSASRISVFAFSTPLFGIAISHLFRGDPLTPWILVSAACVAAGIFLVNRGAGTRSPGSAPTSTAGASTSTREPPPRS